MIEKEGINPSTLGLLIFISLNTNKGYIRDIIKSYMYEFTTNSGKKPADILEEAGYIEYIKTGKELWDKVRLSEKGKQIIKSINEKPQHELSEECWKILEDLYKKYDVDKSKIVNKSKTIYYISEFLYTKEEEGKKYDVKMWKAVIDSYLSSFEYERKIYIPKTINLLFKSDNVYATKFNKDSSPLYQYSISSLESIRKSYSKLK